MGRIGAAMELIKDLSLETLSLTKTQALCGYAFDFLADSAEIQDREEVSALRASTSGSNRSSFRLPKIPTEDEHHELVLRLREESRIYLDLQNLVHLIILFQDWRAEEDRLIL
jgi:nuclear pore complex protein Nup107